MSNSKQGVPETIPQKGPFPTQGNWGKEPAQPVPYQSAKATPNPRVK